MKLAALCGALGSTFACAQFQPAAPLPPYTCGSEVPGASTASAGSLAEGEPLVDLTSAIFVRDDDAGSLQLLFSDQPDACGWLPALLDAGGAPPTTGSDGGGFAIVTVSVFGHDCETFAISQNSVSEGSASAVARFEVVGGSSAPQWSAEGAMQDGALTLTQVSETTVSGRYVFNFESGEPDAGLVIGSFVATPCAALAALTP